MSEGRGGGGENRSKEGQAETYQVIGLDHRDNAEQMLRPIHMAPLLLVELHRVVGSEGLPAIAGANDRLE